MSEIETFKFNNSEIKYYVVDGQPWFRGKDIAIILEYTNTEQALRVNVDNDDKLKLKEIKTAINSGLTYNDKQATYISMSTVYTHLFLEVRNNRHNYSKDGYAQRYCHPFVKLDRT